MTEEMFQIESYTLGVLPRDKFLYYIKIEGEDHICQFYFRPDDHTLPIPKKIRAKEYMAYYHYSQYAALVDLLRNESPLYFTFHLNGTKNYSRLLTDKEPIGENE